MPAVNQEILTSFPVIQTNRLDLIEINQNHLSDLFELFSDENVTKYYNLNTLTKVNEAQKLVDWFQLQFKNKSGLRWGLALKGEQKIIGTIGFNNFTKEHRANLGFDLQKKDWNKGYTSEALTAVLEFGFKVLEINRVEAEVMQGNIGSEKVLGKLGFKKEGILRQWMFWEGNHYDMSMFSLLRTERR